VRRLAASVAVLLAVALAGCSSESSGSSASRGAGSGGPTGTITVLAASSLTETFTTLGEQFEAAHPGTTVTLSFAASSALATQITSGAPADLFASASTATMDRVVQAGAATSPTPFAVNTMEIAVPPSNPGGVDALADLADPAVKVAVCQPQVPCGVAAAKVFSNAGITVQPVTLEPDVKSVLSKVTLGEVDAGVVYVTDVKAAGTTVAGVPVPADVNATTTYPIAALTGSKNQALAQQFVDYVLSGAGASVLSAAGFGTP